MVRRHTERKDVHLIQSDDGVPISVECEEADSFDDHERCDGYMRVMGYRAYCECWCHRSEEEDASDD